MNKIINKRHMRAEKLGEIVVCLVLNGEKEALKLAHLQAKSLKAIIDPSYLTKSERENIAITSASLVSQAKTLIADAHVRGRAFRSTG